MCVCVCVCVCVSVCVCVHVCACVFMGTQCVAVITNLSSPKGHWGDSDRCFLVELCLTPPLAQLRRGERVSTMCLNTCWTAKCTRCEQGRDLQEESAGEGDSVWE